MLAGQCSCVSSLGAIFWYLSVIVACHCDIHWIDKVLSYQPRVTVTSCFVYKTIRDLESIDHLCINPIRRIGLIHKCG